MAIYSRGLRTFSWLCVIATLALIFIGGLVTSNGAGMAVPDWPLSFGSLNPEGWWGNFAVRLEHGHRLFASTVALCTAFLAAWIWRRWWALLVAMLVSIVSVSAGKSMGFSPMTLMHLSIWPAAFAFVITLVFRNQGEAQGACGTVRGLAIAAFVGVCLQATLGGVRVTEGTATGSGYTGLPLLLAMLHGCVAQAFLCSLVAIAVLMRPGLKRRESGDVRMPVIPWLLVGVVYVQLVLGAVVRHSGAGMAIPDFPLSFGGLIPKYHSFAIDIQFAHRLWGLVVSTLVLCVFVSGWNRFNRERFLLGSTLVALTAFQVALGAHIIWLSRPPITTTLHVVNGAAILSVSLVLALRGSEGGRKSYRLPVTTLHGAPA